VSMARLFNIVRNVRESVTDMAYLVSLTDLNTGFAVYSVVVFSVSVEEPIKLQKT
jgi:hypothetical protein